jgi:hypothetical protein
MPSESRPFEEFASTDQAGVAQLVEQLICNQ